MHLQLNGFASLKNLPISWEGNPRNKRSQETLISRIKTHPQKREFSEGSIQHACFLHLTVASAAAAAIDAFICPIPEGTQ